jgi:phage-related protein
MDKWFHSQSKLLQVLLLIIPVVNWIVEIVVRWSAFLGSKKHDLLRLLVCIIVTIPSGVFIGWLDAIWTLLFNRLILE